MGSVIRCQCGEKMVPRVFSQIIDYKCPKVRFWNFLAHSVNVAFFHV